MAAATTFIGLTLLKVASPNRHFCGRGLHPTLATQLVDCEGYERIAQRYGTVAVATRCHEDVLATIDRVLRTLAQERDTALP